MKAKLGLLVVVLLIVAMIPALAMASGQAKPQKTGQFVTYHTGSTNNTWRLVNMDLKNVPGYGSMLGEPGVIITWGFMSDGSYVDRGAIVDVVRIRATGPNN